MRKQDTVRKVEKRKEGRKIGGERKEGKKRGREGEIGGKKGRKVGRGEGWED